MKQVQHKQAFFERAGSGAPPNSSSMGVWCIYVKLCVCEHVDFATSCVYDYDTD